MFADLSRHLPRVVVLAFTGPVAAAALLSCAPTHDHDHSGPSTSVVIDPMTPPTRLRWQSFQGIALPVTDQGPARVEGAVASGFAPMPAGAAVAAIQASVRMSTAPDSQWPQVGAHMLAPGTGRDDWALARARVSITGPAADEAPTLTGYLVTRFTLDTTDVDIYTHFPDGSLTCHHTTVVWQDDDWRLVVPETTDPRARLTAVTETPASLVVLAPR